MTVEGEATESRPGDLNSRLRIPRRTDLDLDLLRRERLGRLQQAMRSHEMAVCVLFGQANIRYATGTSVMSVWASTAMPRCCVVPASGDPVLFEYPKSVECSRQVVDDVRPMPRLGPEAWVKELLGLLREFEVDHSRMPIDQLTIARFGALADAGVAVTESTPATEAAREIKTAQEIEILKLNGAIGDTMLYDFERAIRPGVREYELLAVLSDSLLRHEGEGLFTRLVASGRNTNPWMSEAHDKMVMPGDLVGVDADSYGFEGYVIDVSRTFLCGEHATAEQREAYRVAYEAVSAMRDLVRPGVSYEDFARAVPRLPEKSRAQRYIGLAHQVGLEDGEGPDIPFVEDVEEGIRTFPDATIRPGMVFCLESYVGAVGEHCGVKLEDQVLVTDSGCELLSTYPFSETLLR